MKERIHKTFALLMTVLLVSSTISFTVHKHVCGSFLQDVSLFVASDGCDMKIINTASCETKTSKSCCKDLVDIIEGRDDLKINIDNLDIPQQDFIIAFTYSYSYLFSGEESVISPYNEYTPPLVTSDIYVIDQSFLI